MQVFRILQQQHAGTPLVGIGAALYPGRWNSKGIGMVYTASSRSLATLEVLAHATAGRMPLAQVMVTLDVPDDAIAPAAALPTDWNALPYRAGVRAVGDAWIAGGTSLALRVPSAVVPEEFNILLNPAHARLSDVEVVTSSAGVWDERLIRLVRGQ